MAVDRTPGIRPRPTFWRQLDAAARVCFPASITALMLLLLAAPLGLPGQAELQIAVALSCVFFWSLFRPASMTPPMVFMIGLLADLLGDAPPGLNVLVLLAVHGLALRWRTSLARRGFLLVWLVFVAVAYLAAMSGWALTSLINFSLLAPAPALFQAVLSAGIYPAMAVLFIRAHRSLADPDLA
jgi:rod shape-determining protein MreD